MISQYSSLMQKDSHALSVPNLPAMVLFPKYTQMKEDDRAVIWIMTFSRVVVHLRGSSVVAFKDGERQAVGSKHIRSPWCCRRQDCCCLRITYPPCLRYNTHREAHLLTFLCLLNTCGYKLLDKSDVFQSKLVSWKRCHLECMQLKSVLQNSTSKIAKSPFSSHTLELCPCHLLYILFKSLSIHKTGLSHCKTIIAAVMWYIILRLLV